MTADTDEALVRRAAAGDEPAFGQLMRRHKEGLYRFLRRLTGDPEEAHDLLQDSFVAIWRNLGSFDADRPFLPWAQRIAHYAGEKKTGADNSASGSIKLAKERIELMKMYDIID